MVVTYLYRKLWMYEANRSKRAPLERQECSHTQSAGAPQGSIPMSASVRVRKFPHFSWVWAVGAFRFCSGYPWFKWMGALLEGSLSQSPFPLGNLPLETPRKICRGGSLRSCFKPTNKSFQISLSPALWGTFPIAHIHPQMCARPPCRHWRFGNRNHEQIERMAVVRQSRNGWFSRLNFSVLIYRWNQTNEETLSSSALDTGSHLWS